MSQNSPTGRGFATESMGHVFGTLGPLVAAALRGGPIRVRETVDSETARPRQLRYRGI
ncbi:protein of unknown function [Rhodococcus sp. RD6.2]|nr:protein of unknown function [Rhodococcus sp. RD6.2]